MRDNDILDDPGTFKRFSGHWSGAKYFGVGVAFGLAGFALSSGLEYWFQGNESKALQSLLMIFSILGGIAYLFFNATGAIISLSYLFTGKNRDEKIAGLVSLLLNLSPYFIVLMAMYFIEK